MSPMGAGLIFLRLLQTAFMDQAQLYSLNLLHAYTLLKLDEP